MRNPADLLEAPADPAAEVSAETLDLLRRCDVLSLDVFDTAIHRAVGRPIDVFSLAAAALLEDPRWSRSAGVISRFADQRVVAEALARQIKEDSAGTREVGLGDIYRVLADLLGDASAALIDALKEAELCVERQVVYANPSVLALTQKARALGKRIVFCSDMYLDAPTIASLLEHAGYRGFDRVFVSSELGTSKHEGRLYGLVAGVLGVPPHRILHLGDNGHADVDRARDAGVNALHRPYVQPARTFEEPALPAAANASANDLRAVATIAGLRARAETVHRSKLADPWVHAGFHVFGPLFTGYAVWIHESLRQLRPDVTLFLARDAYLLLELHRALCRRSGFEHRVEYTYASRASLLLDSFTDFNLDRLYSLFSGRAGRSVGATLAKLGLRPEAHRAQIRAAGFSSEDEPAVSGDERVHRLLSCLFEPLLEVARERRTLSGEYLRGIVGDARQVGIVDVGWMGNMQASLLRLLGPDHNTKRLSGLYLGLSKEVTQNLYPGHQLRGWLWDRGLPEERRNALWGGGVELLEFALAAPHGSTLGYRRNVRGEVEPELEENPAETEYLQNAARLQIGVRVFFEDFLALTRGLPLEAFVSERWADAFFRMTVNPTPAQARAFGSLTHSDGAGDTRVRLPIAALLPDDAGRAETEQALATSFWRYGFAVLNRDLLARHGLAQPIR